MGSQGWCLSCDRADLSSGRGDGWLVGPMAGQQKRGNSKAAALVRLTLSEQILSGPLHSLTADRWL